MPTATEDRTLQVGDRVRYTGELTPGLVGETATVERNEYADEWRVRWDDGGLHYPPTIIAGQRLTKIEDAPRPFQTGDVVNVISGPYMGRTNETINSVTTDGNSIYLSTHTLVRPDEIRLVEQAQQPSPEVGPGSWVEITQAPDGYPPSLIGRRFEVRRMGDHSVPPDTVVLRETGLGLPSILHPDEYVVLNEGDEQQSTEEPRTPQVGDRVRLLHTTGLGSEASAGDLGEAAVVDGTLILMRFDSGYTNGGDDGWWVAHDQVEVVDEQPASFQVGARVRITHSFSSARVHVGDLGTIAHEHGAHWLVHLDSGVNNGFTDGWYVAEDQMKLVTDEPAPTQPETAGVSATIDIEFVLHNACTAEPTDILHYLRQHVESAQRDADAGNHIQKVDRRTISVIHSERPEPAYECEHCGSTIVRAHAYATQILSGSGSTTVDASDEDNLFGSIDIDFHDGEHEVQVDDIEFTCDSCGRRVSERLLADLGIDTDLEVY